MPTTLILGASPNPSRYAYRAAHSLQAVGEALVLVGVRPGVVAGVAIQQAFPAAGTVETVTLYLGPERQAEYYAAIVALRPKRVIFNPGTENPAFARQLRQAGIEPVVACTLVLIATGQYALPGA